MKNVIRYLQDSNSEDSIVREIAKGILLYQSIDTDRKIDDFSGALYNYFVYECVMDNQYVTVSASAYGEIHGTYRELIIALRKIDSTKPSVDAIRAIVRAHRAKLIAIIGGKGGEEDRQIVVPCAEYSVDLQWKLLRLSSIELIEPILDVGCGKDARLVRALAEKGLLAFGIDQYLGDSPSILRENWLEFRFMPDSWGMIVSHMAFTNHLRRAMVLGAPDAAAYVSKYHEILVSLKPGGKFVYAPSVPELEGSLDAARYLVKRFANIEGDSKLDTVHVKRIGPCPPN